MRQKMMWRYYCGHCKKTGGQKAAMVKHESRCFFNPLRICTFCEAMQVCQQTIEDLIAALASKGVDGLRELAEGCPACMNAAINQHRHSMDKDAAWPTYDFNYATEAKSVQEDIHRLDWEGVAGYYG